MTDSIIAAIKHKLDQAQSIQVSAHVRPDGDAVGSVLGLGLALESAGKEVHMILSDGMPKDLCFLEGSDRVTTKRNGPVDVVVVLDTADKDRAGHALDGVDTVDINIDHHISNTNYAELNYVVEATSTTQILTDLIPKLGLEISKPISEALLAGLITDSQGFSTQNVTSDALRAAANLVEHGVDLPDLYFKILTKKPYIAAKYWGVGLSHMQQENGVVWTTLSEEDRKAVDYPGRDDADLVNFLSRIDEAQIAVLFIEQSEKKIKVSWRAKAGYNVSDLAGKFGGGGHAAASGAMIEGSLKEVSQKVILETQKIV